MSNPVAERALARTAENGVTFEALVESASRSFGKSHLRTAAATLQSAARFAWYNHPGTFRSRRLESLAAQIGDHLPPSHGMGNELTGHVVHVLSQAYAAGGHTRLVWRWIENDPTHINSVVLTGQQGIPVPPQLADAVVASGGRIISLGETSSSLLVRAAELRGIAQTADTMVLHVHPYDVVPSIALTNVPAKVVFLNHADHVFWVGTAIADVVADIRPAGQRLSIAERNSPATLSTIVPIPLSAPPLGDRRQARERLGIAHDAIVLISIASGYKYGALPGHHFIDIHREFVLSHPKVTLIVIGPVSEGRWQSISEETGGRFKAIGMVQGLEAYYDAADIYIDSIPFASLTSLLDAAARGIPVLALSETVADSVLTSNDLSMVGKGVHYSERREYIQALETLAAAPELRRLQGETIGSAVELDHLSPGWNVHLDGLFEKLSMLPDESPVPAAEWGMLKSSVGELEVALVNFQAASGLVEPLWACRLRDAPYLPLWGRFQLLRAVPVGQRLASLKFMMPDSLRTKVKTGLARLKRP